MGLLDDIELFARSQAEMDAARVDAERKLAEQYGSLAAYTGAQFAPGSATLEARGGMAQPPELGLPVSDLPKYMVEGEKLPSMAETYDVFQSADPYMEQPSAGYVPKRPMPNPQAQQSALDLLLLGMGVTGDALQAGGGAAGAIAGGALKIPRAIQKFNRLINNYNADPFGFRSKLIEELRIAKNEGMTFQNFQALENYLKKKGVKPEEINTMFQLRNMSEKDQFVRFSPGQEYSKKIDPGKVLDNAAFDSPNRRTLITEEAYGGILQQKVNEKDGIAVTAVVGDNPYIDQGFHVMHPREIDEQYLGQDLNDQAYVLSFDTKLDQTNPATPTMADFTGFMDDQSQHWRKDYFDADGKLRVDVPRRDVLGHYRTTDRIYMDPKDNQPKRILFLEEVQSDFLGNLNDLRAAQRMRQEAENDLQEIRWIEGDQTELAQTRLGDRKILDLKQHNALIKKLAIEKRDRLLALAKKLRGEDAPTDQSAVNIPKDFQLDYYDILELAEEMDKAVDNTGGALSIEELSDYDMKIYQIIKDMSQATLETDDLLSTRTSVAPFAKDPKKMYDALVKRIKTRAYRQGYDGIALAPGEVHVDRWAGSGLHTDKQKEGMRKIYSDLIQPRINKAMGHKADDTMRMENPDIDRDDPDAGGYGRIYNAPVWLFTEDDLKKIETEGVYEYKDGGAVNKMVNDVDIFS